MKTKKQQSRFSALLFFARAVETEKRFFLSSINANAAPKEAVGEIWISGTVHMHARPEVWGRGSVVRSEYIIRMLIAMFLGFDKVFEIAPVAPKTTSVFVAPALSVKNT